MSELIINGGRRLFGETEVQGSKNSALPIMAATLLTKEECILENCPDISDVDAAVRILTTLGADVHKTENKLCIHALNIDGSIIDRYLMEKMRSSVMFTGAILARMGEAVICYPGGCKIGDRPIDIHINSLRSLGAEIDDTGECICCKLKNPPSGDVTLMYPSVGATENIMLMCATSGKETRVYNPAKEPEIVDLQNFLNLMGANISGAGSDMIKIMPAEKLHGCRYKIMPDRIVASTYACAAAACGGCVTVKGAEPSHLKLVLEGLKKCGCAIDCGDGIFRVQAYKRLTAIRGIKTLPYPGFPTDVQPLFCAALATANGISEVDETIFENRFGYIKELKKMGADISIYNCRAEICGVDDLRGAEVEARDLRGGAALVIAGLSSKGTTVVSGVNYIDRGYEKIEENFRRLGADVYRI